MIASQFLLAYLAASMLCIAAPGPDSLSVLSIGLSRGRRDAMFFAAGVGAGCLTHTAWAALGIAAAVAASDGAFTAIKLAGAAYLLWLGVSALRSAGATFAPATAGTPGGRDGMADGGIDTTRRGAGAGAGGGTDAVSTARTGSTSPARRFAQGFVNNSLNPKVMLFFIAFLPQFVDTAAGPAWAQMLSLGAGFAAMTAASYVLLGAASGRVGEALARRPAFTRAFDRLTGCLFIGLAARLALAGRH